MCVAIHDVAPATWPECLHLWHAVRAVADIPLTWLVVPRYHGSRLRSRSCEATLDSALGEGHELVLHGLTHSDAMPPRWSITDRMVRVAYARHEAEFAALDAAEARRRIEQGLAWFGERKWPVEGFVAPAWLLGSGARQVLGDYPLRYTTTYRRFHLLPEGDAILAPALVYAARNRCGRLLSPPAADGLARLCRTMPLVRVALHPNDAHFPELVLHAQRLIARLLESRVPMTKAAYAARLQSTLSASARPQQSGTAAQS